MRTTRIFHSRITRRTAPRRRRCLHYSLSYRAYLPTIGTGFCMHTYIGSAADPAVIPCRHTDAFAARRLYRTPR